MIAIVEKPYGWRIEENASSNPDRPLWFEWQELFATEQGAKRELLRQGRGWAFVVRLGGGK